YLLGNRPDARPGRPLGRPVDPGTSGTAGRPWTPGQNCVLGRGLLDEVVDHLRRGVVHLHVEVLEAARQVVVEPHRRNGDEEAERGLDERFRNTGRDGADAARTRRGDTDERVDDADDRAEQTDERRGRADGREARDALLEVV